MSKKETIVFHSFPSWDAPYKKSTIELIQELDKDKDILFIDYPYSLKDLIFKSYVPKWNILGVKSRLRQFQNANNARISVFSSAPILPHIPLFKALIQKINNLILRRSCKRIARKLRLENTIYINAMNPKWSSMAEIFKPKRRVYYAYDNMEAMSWAKLHQLPYEGKYCEDSDLVITSSGALRDKLKVRNPNTFTVFNGFDHRVFSPKLEASQENLVSYLGAIDDRIDFDLLESMLSENPKLKFQFIGPVKDERIFKLKQQYSNLILTGSKSQEESADLLQDSAVCIIPFRSNEFTRFIYPLKINEYLAMGKAVISTDFSVDIESFSGIIDICRSHSEFNFALQNAQLQNCGDRIAERVSFSKEQSWRKRAQLLQTLIAS